MARKALVSQSTGNAATHEIFAMNDTPVGENQENRRLTDVKLIQFFLFHFYKDNPNLFRSLPPTKRRNSYVMIDGICGQQTKAGISIFQKEMAGFGFSIWADGIVHTYKAINGPIHNTTLTIWWLNKWFFSSDYGRGWESNLENHPLMLGSAPDLSAELRASATLPQLMRVIP